LKSWYTARILCFNKRFKRNCTISTGIPNLWCKKLSNWTSGVGQNNQPPTPRVVRNPTLTPPKTFDSDSATMVTSYVNCRQLYY